MIDVAPGSEAIVELTGVRGNPIETIVRVRATECGECRICTDGHAVTVFSPKDKGTTTCTKWEMDDVADELSNNPLCYKFADQELMGQKVCFCCLFVVKMS